jgi:hypothetical protein
MANTWMDKLIVELREAAEDPNNKGGRVEYLLLTAAHFLSDQSAEIDSLNSMIREMGRENENLRTLYDNRVEYG